MASRLARALTFAAAALLCAPAALAQVRILGQPGSWPTLQTAIDAAVDGDILVVEDGSYTGNFTIDDKALTVLARNIGQAFIFGHCAVRNLAGKRSVSLVDLHIQAPNSSNLEPPSGLTLSDCAGQVLIQGCTLRGGKFSSQYYPGTPAGHGLEAQTCERVLVVGSSLVGQDFGSWSGGEPRSGGDGLRAVESAVVVYSSLLQGGEGSHESNPEGGDGGAGARVSGWGLFAAGTTFKGGRGGGGDYIGCTLSGDGGDGITLTQAQAWLLDDTLIPGLAGFFSTCGPGSPGLPITANNSVVQQLPGKARNLVGPAWTFDNSSTAITVSGQPGDSVWLLHAPQGAWAFAPALNGWAAIPRPWRMPIVPAGVIGAGGTLVVPLEIPDLSGSESGWMWSLQALCVDPAGKTFLSSPRGLIVVDT